MRVNSCAYLYVDPASRECWQSNIEPTDEQKQRLMIFTKDDNFFEQAADSLGGWDEIGVSDCLTDDERKHLGWF